MIDQPKRRHPTHGIKHIGGQPTIIFDTLCLKYRAPILACDEFHRAFRDVAEHATAWLTGRYVIMPDHIHFFAEVDTEIPYENWVCYLKSQITKQFAPDRRNQNTGGRGSRRAADSTEADGRGSHRAETLRQLPAPQERRPPDFRWLTDHWDTRVRSAAAYEEKWNYIRDNPVRKGLVASTTIGPIKAKYSNCDGPNHTVASKR